MKFFHTADIHLGAMPDSSFPWGEKRKQEIWESFSRLIAEAEKEQIDLLLIAGDLFHRQPLLRELKELNYLFSKLSKTKVVIIAGNHDYLKKDSYYWSFEWEKNVTVLLSAECDHIEFPEFHTSVYGLSYHTREIAAACYDNLTPQVTDGMFNILLAHGGDEKHIPVDKRKLQISNFDYIALGHIHKPSELISNKAHYAGALEPLDKNDMGTHGFIAGSYEKGELSLTFRPWAVREYISLEITVTEQETDLSLSEKIKELIQNDGIENIYKIKIMGYRDEDILFETDRYSEYGNIVEVRDESSPAYDFKKLANQHQDDIVGQYIDRLYKSKMNKTEYKALYYGIQALLETKE